MAREADLASGWNVGAQGQVPCRECPSVRGCLLSPRKGRLTAGFQTWQSIERSWEKN